MAKKYAVIGWNEADVKAALESFETDNEGFDEPLGLELSKAEMAEFLERIESEMETEIASYGFNFIKEKLVLYINSRIRKLKT